jgi:hypothetical protein
VGNNGETLVADSSTSTGLRYQGSNAAGRNFIINGAFDIWQRGTSASIAASQILKFSADRWITSTNANQAITISRQATGDTTNLPNIQYCARYQRNSGQTGTGGVFFTQNVETANAIPLAGKTFTFSFYARAGANFSPTSSVLQTLIYAGTGTDENVLSGYTGNTNPANFSPTLTTTWQRFSVSGTFASNVTEFAPIFYYVPTGTAGANDYFEVTGVQLELGSVATAFTRTGGTIQGELAACQRYYWNWKSGNSLTMGIGRYTTATEMGIYTMFPVTMRTAPSLVATTGTNYYSIGSDGFNSFTIFQQDTSSAWLYNLSEVSGTGGNTDRVYTNNAAASVSFSAEL